MSDGGTRLGPDGVDAAPSVFISYRRDDTAGYAGRLYDALRGRFGADHVFIDVDNIRPGVDFVAHLSAAVERCDVLLALIGPDWLSAVDEAGGRRLDDPRDFVRIEIESALRRGILVVPVLLQGAPVPRATDLPEPLRPLATINALEMSNTRWRADLDVLIAAIGGGRQPTDPATGADHDVETTESAVTAAADASGYRALLFSDLRGYTAFVEQRGDAEAAALLHRYRTVVREVIARYAGAEIRTEGDSFFVVFGSASTALRAALGIVQGAGVAVDQEPRYPIQVGIGIHAGEITDTAEGPVGSAVNIAARICAQARAGEILVSETVRGLVRTSVPVEFASRGRRPLKGVREPIRLYAVVGHGISGLSPHTQAVVGSRVQLGRSVAATAAIAAVVAIGIGVAVLRPLGAAPAASPVPTSLTVGASASLDVPASAPSSAIPPTAESTATANPTAGSAKTVSTPGPSVFPTDAEQALLDHVPTTIAPHCERATAAAGALGGLVSLRCPLPDQDADVVWYDKFVTRATADERFQRLATAAGVPDGECSTSVTEAVGQWRVGSGIAGDLLCYGANGAAWIIWTHTAEPIVAQATRADGDAPALYTWWKGVGPYLR